jgi:lipopolysaccharide/colanic/teichoic acid biosynthesis glycosyltransferase
MKASAARVVASAARSPLIPNGKFNTLENFQHHVERDLYYIESWSLLFDLYILLRTPFALMKAENAY